MQEMEAEVDVPDEPFMPAIDDDFSDCAGPISEESDEEIEGRGNIHFLAKLKKWKYITQIAAP